MGSLYPVCGFETIPGDTVQIQNRVLIRVTPLATPVMHPCVVRLHTYFVPNRILDPADGSFKWENFITGGEDGTYVTPPPTASAVTVTEGDVADYFGITPGTRTYNVFLMRAYAKIWNEFYRDQQLQTALDVDTYTGATAPQKVSWARDYFTEARPEAQLGDAVTLSVGSQAPIKTAAPVSGGNPSIFTTDDDTQRIMTAGGANVGLGAVDAAGGDMYADLSAANAIDINDVRRAFALQRYKEARNLYGARFVEYLRYLGIRSSDARLQRPEYIGGGKGLISFSEVLSTDDGGTNPVGSMSGHGIANVTTRPSRYFCEEEGHVITLMSVRPIAIYMQAQHQMFNRTTKEEYWQKELQQIGQQAVENREIYVDHTTPTGTFGWNDRYRAFKEVPNLAVGEFRSSLNSWHLGRDFGSDPALNSSFIECDPTDRVYADTSGTTDKLWCMVNNKVAVRSMLRKGGTNRIL